MEDDQPYPVHATSPRYPLLSPDGVRPPPLAAGVGLAAGAGTWEKRAVALQEQLDLLQAQLAQDHSDLAALKAQAASADLNMEELRDALEDLIRDNAEVIDEAEEDTEDDGAARSLALESQLATTKIGLAEERFQRDTLEGQVRALRKEAQAMGYMPEELLAMPHGGVPAMVDPGIVSADVAYLVNGVHQHGSLQIDHRTLTFVPEHVKQLELAGDEADTRKHRLEIALTAVHEASLAEIKATQNASELASLLATIQVSSPTMPHTSFVGFKEQMYRLYERLEMVQAANLEHSHCTPNIDQKLSDPSHVLKPAHFASLARFVPARYRSCDWSLIYSTTEHGISLQTFYSRVSKLRPTLVAIRDTTGASFGCFVSTPWTQTHRYYGNGESFVFKAAPEFRVYKWSGRDSFFQFSNHEYIAVGGGSHFAMWVDSELLMGTSGESQTYNNPGLAPSTEFSIVVLEAWSLVTPGHFPKS